MAIDGADLRSPLLRETVQLDPQGGPGATLWRGWLFGPSVVLVQPAAAVATVGTATATVVAQDYKLVTPAAAAITVGTATPVVGTSGVSTLVVPCTLSSGVLFASTRAGPANVVGILDTEDPDYSPWLGVQEGGAAGDWQVACLAFDTSSLGSGVTVTSVVLTLNGWPAGFLQFGAGFIAIPVEARLYDWGTLALGDWVAGDSLSGLTLLAHGTVPAYPDFDQPQTFDLTSDALAANIDKTGTTRLLLHTEGTRTGDALHDGDIDTADTAIGDVDVGQIHDWPGFVPYLTIEYTAGGADTLVQPVAAAVAVGTSTPALVAQNWPRVQPAAATITIGTATPTVVAQNWPRVQPAAAAVTIGTATPAITTLVGVQPAAAAVAVAGATPAVVAQNYILRQPGAAAIAATPATPALVAQNYIRVQPAAAAIAITTATPAVSAVVTTVVQPGAATVAIGTATPVVTATANTIRQPAAAAVAFAGMAPDVTATENVIVFPGALGFVIDTATPLVVLPKRPLGLPAVMRLTEIPVRSQISASYETQIADGRLAA